eukprot:7030687-Prymnesium_polylepis.2
MNHACDAGFLGCVVRRATVDLGENPRECLKPIAVAPVSRFAFTSHTQASCPSSHRHLAVARGHSTHIQYWGAASRSVCRVKQ